MRKTDRFSKERAKSSLSLKVKLFAVMLGGLLIAGGVFFGVYSVGKFLVWRHYESMSAEQMREQNQGYVDDLQKYININRLYIEDVDRISEWKVGKHVELVFYQDRDLIYLDEKATGGNFEDFLSEDDKRKYDETLQSILDGNMDAYPVSFVDGTLLVTIVDEGENFLNSLVFVIAILLAIIVLTTIMLVYFGYVTKRIRRLAFTVKTVEEGDIHRPIEDAGHDEIGKLASDVNSMRNSVIDNMSKEREAWEANAGLITAMSHDIRTPLTVMLGYLELMELQNTDAANGEYLEACRQNALKLKKLSDDMFSYFLVFGKRDVELDSQEVDAGVIINHMLEEHCVLLSEMGYNINCSFEADRARVKIDTVYFNRVVDNVFSNVGKYADSKETVEVRTFVESGELVISISNYIAEDTSGAESNRIGMKTCVKIMEQFGGSFTSRRIDDTFVSEIKLPLV